VSGTSTSTISGTAALPLDGLGGERLRLDYDRPGTAPVNSARTTVEPPKIDVLGGQPPSRGVHAHDVGEHRQVEPRRSRAAMSRPSWVAPMRMASGRLSAASWAAMAAATFGPGSDLADVTRLYSLVTP